MPEAVWPIRAGFFWNAEFAPQLGDSLEIGRGAGVPERGFQRAKQDALAAGEPQESKARAFCSAAIAML